MRQIRGFEEAREALSKRRSGLGLMETTPVAEAKTREVFGRALTPEEAVREILERVKIGGDRAVVEFTRLLDGVELSSGLEVSEGEWARARSRVRRSVVRALEEAAERVKAYQQAAMPKSWLDIKEGYGQMFIPMERVGVYIPGGTAAYPSTVIMTAIPARIAGVKEIVLCTPSRGGQGPDAGVLAAAAIGGVDRVFQIGGPQAIAAMAFGTETVPRVDMVCGPGNIFVTLAKKQVYGAVAVDGLYGPTETVVIADGKADPAHCAADLLAQAEHDWLASPIFITDTAELAVKVEQELSALLDKLPRREIASQALERQGLMVVVDTLEEAVDLANIYAPEHLCLLVLDPWALLAKVSNAGGVFLGTTTPEAIGDYMAGPSHVMPTGGTARFGSALSVLSFLKAVAVVALDREKGKALTPSAAALARYEGFVGHARAMEMRIG
ncbi:MAG: histidinol dehydrogenase [Chloroflexi bacterium]|nr:histidinol dehydrogenase [Chloroflexota bacterium]